jgi:hypothetical protein
MLQMHGALVSVGCNRFDFSFFLCSPIFFCVILYETLTSVCLIFTYLHFFSFRPLSWSEGPAEGALIRTRNPPDRVVLQGFGHDARALE